MRAARLVALVGVALAACAYQVHGFVKPEGAYGEVLSRTTRGATLLHNPDELLYIFATIESPELRAARTERLSLAVNVPSDKAAFYGGDVTEPMEGLVFFLSVHTGDSGANDLEMAASRWSIRLLGPAGYVSPGKIVRIRSRYEAVEALYPYVDRAFATYRIAFPVTYDPRATYTLEINGARDRARLVFNDYSS